MSNIVFAKLVVESLLLELLLLSLPFVYTKVAESLYSISILLG